MRNHTFAQIKKKVTDVGEVLEKLKPLHLLDEISKCTAAIENNVNSLLNYKTTYCPTKKLPKRIVVSILNKLSIFIIVIVTVAKMSNSSIYWLVNKEICHMHVMGCILF